MIKGLRWLFEEDRKDTAQILGLRLRQRYNIGTAHGAQGDMTNRTFLGRTNIHIALDVFANMDSNTVKKQVLFLEQKRGGSR